MDILISVSLSALSQKMYVTDRVSHNRDTGAEVILIFTGLTERNPAVVAVKRLRIRSKT